MTDRVDGHLHMAAGIAKAMSGERHAEVLAGMATLAASMIADVAVSADDAKAQARAFTARVEAGIAKRFAPAFAKGEHAK